MFPLRAYACGGGNSRYDAVRSLLRLESKSNAWVEPGPMNQKRHDAAVAVMSGMIYVCGGRSRGTLHSVERFSPDLHA